MSVKKPQAKDASRIWIVHGLIGVTVLGSALAIGTVHVIALLAIAPIALVAGSICVWKRGLRRAFPPPVLLAAALGVFSAAQAVSLPRAVLESLSPSSAQLWRGAAKLLDEPYRWASISLEPGASLRESLKWLSYAGLLAASAYVARRRTARPVITIVFASAVVVAVVALAHRVTGAGALYGVYEPRYANTWLLAPMLNPNNLGGYLALGAITGVGTVLVKASPGRRGVTIAGTVACMVVVAMTGSGGAVVALIVGLSAFLAWRAISKRGTPGLPSDLSARAFIGVSVVGMVWGVLAYRQWYEWPWGRLELGGGSKLGYAVEAYWPLVSDYAWLGVGRGAFGGVSPAYERGLTENSAAAYPENFLLQWAGEWGIPVASIALIGFAWFFRPSRMALRRRPSNLAAYVGVGALLLQNLVDLSVELPAVSYAVAAVLGGLWGEGSRLEAPKSIRGPAPRRAAAAQMTVCVALCTGVFSAAVLWGRFDGQHYQTQVHEAYLRVDPQSPRNVQTFWRLTEEAIRARPADPYFYRLGALAAMQVGGNAPVLRWMNQAIMRQPTYGPTHLLAARALDRLGFRNQALLELRLAVEHGPHLKRTVTELALEWTRDFTALLRAVPAGADGVPMLLELARVEEGRLGDQLLDESIKRRETADAHVLRGFRLLANARGKKPPCAYSQDHCLRSVKHHGERALALAPRSSPALSLWGTLLDVRHGPLEAEKFFRKKCPELGMDEYCLSHRVHFALRSGPETTRDAAADMLNTVCPRGRADCARVAEDLANRTTRRGFKHLAVTYLRRAAKEAPSPARWVAVAEAACGLGSLSVCLQAVREAKAFATDEPTLRAQLASFEERAWAQISARE